MPLLTNTKLKMTNESSVAEKALTPVEAAYAAIDVAALRRNGVIVFGSRGQVGREVVLACSKLEIPTKALGRDEADLECVSTDEIAKLVEGSSAAINCAAWTDVAKAEEWSTDQENPNWRVNALFPERLAEACKFAGSVPLVHFSTDFVFEGNEATPRIESDPVAPQTEYGKAKLAGEVCSATPDAKATVLRLGSVFGPRGDSNFPSKILTTAKSVAPRVVVDQIASPVGARYAALAALAAASRWASGKPVPRLVHLASSPVSFFGFAQEILASAEAAGVELACGADSLVPSRLKDFLGGPKRPAYSALSGSLAFVSLGLPLCDRIEELVYFMSVFKELTDR